MVNNQEYKNTSYVIRDALVRLQKEKHDSGDVDAISSIEATLTEMIPIITSSILISINTSNPKILKKLSKLEAGYHETIIQKSEINHGNLRTITYFVEDSMDKIQTFITEINSLENVQSFRYIINEPEEV